LRNTTSYFIFNYHLASCGHHGLSNPVKAIIKYNSSQIAEKFMKNMLLIDSMVEMKKWLQNEWINIPYYINSLIDTTTVVLLSTLFCTRVKEGGV